MRLSLIPGLLNSVRHNFNHGNKDILLFEIGRIFAGREPGELPNEREALAFAATGGATEEGRAQALREIDFFDVKGALEAAVDATKLGPLRFESARVKHLREGQTAVIKLADGVVIGTIGRLAESVAAPYKFRQAVYVCELDLTALLASQAKPVQYKPLARYPSVVRDVTLLVERGVTFATLAQAMIDQKAETCRAVKLVGVYEGSNIPEDKRSVTLRLEYRSDDRTLRDDEVEEIHTKLVAAVALKFAAELH
jgi:phenylalanyl-tRNA synthetase beta chain